MSTVLGIETSCDDTAAALVADGRDVLASVVSSQVDLHALYGGVVPELAGRAHLDALSAVLDKAFADARFAHDPHPSPSLGAVAATVGPGLVGSLLVGVSEAKALALAWDVPFVAVNHLEGHMFAALLEHETLPWPLVTLLVSGGHTLLVSMEGPGRYRRLGATLDDAAGEAFDKVARFLGLGYPGGPAIERAARDGDPAAMALPRPLVNDGLDFSFSGLKTAVVRAVKSRPELSNEDVAASFQAAAVDVLVRKAVAGAKAVSAGGICLAGGVAANGPLRQALEAAAHTLGIPAYLPSRAMCTDNAAMIAAAGWWQLGQVGPSALDTPAEPALGLPFLG
ncbi:MAG: tRNA (adenosine(37)-N6)-threonylcarbamoyltransferase complex transferase subunit TsaD [Acidimicrobiales bacterium]